MSRRLAIAAGALVAIGVFTWLAGPVLATQFGPEALLATYASLAAATGALTYVVVRRVTVQQAASAREPSADGAETEPSEAVDAALVTEELERIRDES